MKFSLATAALFMEQQSETGNMFHDGGYRYEKLPSPSGIVVSESVSDSFLSRRTETILSQECIDEIGFTMFDELYDIAKDSNNDSCENVNGWMNEDGIVVIVEDYRTCDQSEFRTFCDTSANYQTFELPDMKITCDPTPGLFSGLPFMVYEYNKMMCSGKSCPSDPLDWSLEDMLAMFIGNISLCTFDFLEEGDDEPPEEPVAVAENLSQACTDEIDIVFDDDEYKSAQDIMFDECPLQKYMSGNHTIFVGDYRECDTSMLTDFCDAHNYQTVLLPNIKMICPGNMILYSYGGPDCIGTSCPADLSNYLISDIQYIFTGTEQCLFQFLEAGEEPPISNIDSLTVTPSSKGSCVNTEFKMIPNEGKGTEMRCGGLLNQLFAPPKDIEKLKNECNRRIKSTDPNNGSVLVSEACPTFCNFETCCPVDGDFEFLLNNGKKKRCGGLLNALIEDKTVEGKAALAEQCDSELESVSGETVVVEDICAGLCRKGCEVVDCVNKEPDQFLLIPDDKNTDNMLNCDQFLKNVSKKDKKTLCKNKISIYNVEKDKVLMKKQTPKKTCPLYCSNRCKKQLALQ